MATLSLRTGVYAFEDFLEFVTPERKADLIDGVIYMASPESTADNKLGGWLYRLMSEFVEQYDLGEVFYTRVAFRISQRRGPEPDVAFVAKRRRHLIESGFVNGAPDVAVEIVSPDSVERDYEKKWNVYEKAGVREYWIIDPGLRQATFLALYRGKFQPLPLDGTIFNSKVLKGFRIDTKWLWTKRRPSVRRALQKMEPLG
jgi:Uma2 family endonuclease